MILTDNDIVKQIKSGFIEISDFKQENLGSNSYDLTLGSSLLVYTGEELDCKEENPFVRFEIPVDEGYMLLPGQLYLGVTGERTRTKHHMPFIEGKSSIGRLGISIHATAGVGDIGFNGYWTLELSVIKPVRVYAGMPIAQILFLLPLGTCINPYSLKKNAKYKDQEAIPIPSAMWKNFL